MDNHIRQALRGYIEDEKKNRDKIQEMDLSQVNNIDEVFRTSRMRQKFYTYVHNQDKDNSLKYHRRLTDAEMDEMERVNNLDGDFDIAMLNADGGFKQLKNEGGYLALANELKGEYDMRKVLLKRIFNLDV